MDVRVSGASILGEKQSLDPLGDAGHAARWGPRRLMAALHMRHVRGGFKSLHRGTVRKDKGKYWVGQGAAALRMQLKAQ